MKFSIVIPTYNRSDTVKECLELTLNNHGIKKQNIELIWVDDGSTDQKVREVMNFFNPDVCIIKNRNEGTIKTKNIGIAMTTGDWICVVDSDMVITDNWLQILSCIHTQVAGIFEYLLLQFLYGKEF